MGRSWVTRFLVRFFDNCWKQAATGTVRLITSHALEVKVIGTVFLVYGEIVLIARAVQDMDSTRDLVAVDLRTQLVIGRHGSLSARSYSGEVLDGFVEPSIDLRAAFQLLFVS